MEFLNNRCANHTPRTLSATAIVFARDTRTHTSRDDHLHNNTMHQHCSTAVPCLP